MLPSGQNPDPSVGPKIDPALPAAEVRLAFPPRDDLEAQGNGKGRTPDEVRLQHEVSILSRRVTDLEKALSAANARADTELNNRRAEEAYANRTINELRDEVRRQAERARGFQIELSKIELARIAPLEAEAESLKAKVLIVEQITAFIEQAEGFTEVQSRALGLKQRKRPKSPSLSERIEWLGATLKDIESGLTERAEKHRQRGETVEQQRKELGALKNERDELRGSLDRSESAKLAMGEKHAKTLAAEAARREVLEAQLREARDEVVALKAGMEELEASVKNLERYRELAGSLLEQQRSARELQRGPAPQRETRPAPQPEPRDSVGKFLGPKEDLLTFLLSADVDREPVRASINALIEHPEGSALFTNAQQWLADSHEACLESDEHQRNPRTLGLARGSEILCTMLAEEIEKRGAFSFLLSLPVAESQDIVRRLGEPTQRMLISFAAINPEWSHGLHSAQALLFLDSIPAGVRAGIVEGVQDPALAITILFGTNAVRQGIKSVQGSYRIKYGTRTDEHSIAAYRAKVAIADEHANSPEIQAARQALRSYSLLSEERQSLIWRDYPATTEGFKAMKAVLGYDVRDALALVGLQFE